MQTTTTGIPEYKDLNITGEISIKPVAPTEKIESASMTYLIMGSTGAGKSSFIEALAGGTQDLQISKDQLAGYTQSVSAYKLVNVVWGSTNLPIYVVDTPGFSDTKISEKEIMDMVRKWMEENNLPTFDAILFLNPITQPRLAGSKRRTIDMMKAFLKPADNLDSIMFVTTMWDKIHSEQIAHRAEANFAQLRGEILKEFVQEGSEITRFTNSRDSALRVLDSMSTLGATSFSEGVYGASSHLYHDLHERIESALRQKKSLESDIASPEAQSIIELRSILEQNHQENEETLTKFISQLVVFGEVPKGFERIAQDLRKKIAAEVVPVDSEQRALLGSWALESEIPEVVFGEEQLGASSTRHPSPVLHTRSTRLLTLKGLVRRLINVAKRRGNKWFKRRA